MHKITFHSYNPDIEGIVRMIRDATTNKDLQEFIDFCEDMTEKDIDEEMVEELELMK